MNTLELWSAIVGFLLPPVLSVVMQSRWSPQVQGLVAFVACFLVALGTCYLQGVLSEVRDVATAVLIVFSAAISTYRLFWKPSEIAPAIERKTNLHPRP